MRGERQGHGERLIDEPHRWDRESAEVVTELVLAERFDVVGVRVVTKAKKLSDQQAANLYAAVTRARHSVGFIIKPPKNNIIPVWTPDGELSAS